MAGLLLTVCVAASSLGVSRGAFPKVTATDIKKLRAEVREIIDESTLDPLPDPLVTGFTGIQPLLASTVRLAFHDCAGRTDTKGKGAINRCDGCIDFAFDANAGLEENAFDALEALYRGSKSKWSKRMSRADFWMAAATIAIEIGAENAFTTPGAFTVATLTEPPFDSPAQLRDIPFYFGRKDCKTSPDAKEEGVFDFANAKGGLEETVTWFNEVFGFDEAQAVTILGAHTLGAGRLDSSGHLGQWAVSSHVLNNDYYGQLSAPNLNVYQFTQSRVSDLLLCTPQNHCGSNNTQFQWFFGGPPDTPQQGRGFHLNVDLALVLRIEDHLNATSGQVSCTAPTLEELIGGYVLPSRCPYQSTAGLVAAYSSLAFGNSLWISAFADVFEEMITVHEDKKKLQRLIVKYDRSFEDLYVPQTPQPTIDWEVQAMKMATSTVGTYQDEQSTAGGDVDVSAAVVAGISVLFVVVLMLSCLAYRRRKTSVLEQQLNESCVEYGTTG